MIGRELVVLLLVVVAAGVERGVRATLRMVQHTARAGSLETSELPVLLLDESV